MPIYEFQCQACDTVIEVLQKISDPHLTECEACGKPDMKKKVTAAAFRLSGAGWYETDFKEGDKKKNLTDSADTKSDSSKSTEATKSTSTKTESTAKESSKTESSASNESKTPVKESSTKSSD